MNIGDCTDAALIAVDVGSVVASPDHGPAPEERSSEESTTLADLNISRDQSSQWQRKRLIFSSKKFPVFQAKKPFVSACPETEDPILPTGLRGLVFEGQGETRGSGHDAILKSRTGAGREGGRGWMGYESTYTLAQRAKAPGRAGTASVGVDRHVDGRWACGQVYG